MNQDIDNALDDWEYTPGMVQARLVPGRDGRQVIQLRLDLGILQLETSGRPDGTRPHGFSTYFEYLRDQARRAQKAGKDLVLSDEQCMEADREFVQFYHRRVCWLALEKFKRAVADADHTLAFMDFVRTHSPNEDYTEAHEQYRGFVLFQKTQASAAQQVKEKHPEAAIDIIREGITTLREFFTEHGVEDETEENPMLQHLENIAASLRKEHRIEATLQEQLDRAVADEDYEKAARIRDALKRKNV